MVNRQTDVMSFSECLDVWWPLCEALWALWKPSGHFFKSLQSTYTVLRSIISGGHYTSQWRAVCLLYCLDSWQGTIVTGYDCTKMYLRSTISVIIPQDPAYWSLNRGNRVSKRPGIIFWLQPKQEQPVFSCGNGNASTMRHWFRNSLCDSAIAWWRLRLRKISA